MVVQIVLFLHVLGAVGLGYYLVLPFFTTRMKTHTETTLQPFLSSLYGTSRIGQYLLIVQFLTGGYLMSQQKYSVLWMVLTTIVFIAVAAVSGIMNKRMKQAVKVLKDGKSADSLLGTVKALSFVLSVSMLAVLYVMKFPMYA